MFQFDIKNHKLFLKRTQCGLQLKDIFIGNTVKVFSRQIKIVDYADGFTRKKMSISMQRYAGFYIFSISLLLNSKLLAVYRRAQLTEPLPPGYFDIAPPLEGLIWIS